MRPFPWREAMQLGFGVLRLSSKEFWGLTPRELAAAFAAQAGPQTRPPDRTQLMALAERFPDEH